MGQKSSWHRLPWPRIIIILNRFKKINIYVNKRLGKRVGSEREIARLCVSSCA